ncbi:hypothetical protein ACM6Q7_13105 [Peribacillus butanolivorans]|uniref:hypothetical protein n=1 Tax=Peribacillus butanolivorans TaxID=421767 RepID=UPI0039FC6DEB
MAIWIGMIAVTAYVMISGIHGSAWTAVVKDILILVVVLFWSFIFRSTIMAESNRCLK